MEVRKLNTKDLYIVGGMLRKVAPDLRQIQFDKQKNESENEHKMRVGQAVFSLLADKLYEDVWDWLADVSGQSKDDLLAQPIEYVPELINHLAKSEDLTNFFTKVRGLVGKSI
jgi:hypothetical protein